MALVCAMTVPALADLQNVEVGGSVRIRGNYIGGTFTPFMAGAPTPVVRHGGLSVLKRPIGGPFNPNVVSVYDWDHAGADVSFVEQRTRLHVKAEFTDDVNAFIEMDSYDVWGEDFRSNYVTGMDGRAASVDDVEIFQAYIEAENMFDTPVRLRVGRQELAFGSQFLVGPRDFAFFYTGISFDAVRATYATDGYSVDAFASKLAETFGDFGDGDVDFYGVYATCTAVEDFTFDAYWLLLRDDRALANDFNGGFITEWVEDVWGVDDYDTTNLHTVGLRAAGVVGAFDFDAEVAYQFGDASAIGQTFKPGIYGDSDARFDAFALKLDAGYTLDIWNSAHLFAGFRYYGGEDNRDISFLDWINPFYKPTASLSFNRLFSNQIASGFMDLNNDLSNAWLVRGGIEGAVTEKLRGRFCVTYYESLADFDRPVVPLLTWWTNQNDDDLGIETYLFMEYHYSDDLVFEMGWAHLFPGDGLKQGNFNRWYGYLFDGGTDDDGGDYIYGGCKLYF
jgi:hypothetical protein